MILRSSQVAALLKRGRTAADPLVITPTPDLQAEGQQGSASVDLRLGTWFVSLRQARMTHLSVDQPGAPEQLTQMHYVPYGSSYVLHPGGFVLGVTIEWLRIPHNLAAYVIGKSSWGRRGLIIATATGVHPGFKGCLTLELSNIGEIPIELKPGFSLCQLFFHTVKPTRAKEVFRSQFGGRRRPSLGKIVVDRIARQLAWISTLRDWANTGASTAGLGSHPQR